MFKKFLSKIINLRQRYIFISSFLIFFGALSIIYSFGLIDFIRNLFILWPLSIILLGLYFILRNNVTLTYLLTIFNSFVVAIVTLSFILNTQISNLIFPLNHGEKRSIINPNIKYDFGNKINNKADYKKAILKFKSKNGDFNLRGTAKKLIEYDIKKTFGEYQTVESEINGVKIIDIKFDQERIPWNIFSEKNSVDIRLDSNIDWDLDFDISRANLDADLEYYKINKINIYADNLSNVLLKFKNTEIESLFINLNIYTSTIKLRVNKDIGLHIDLDKKFSITNLNNDYFMKDSNNDKILKSLDFDNKKSKIFITGNINTSNLEIIFE